MSVSITYQTETWNRLQKGINYLANTAKIALGPTGRNSLLEKGSMPPLITNNGAAIAEEVVLPDPVANMGVQILKEAASKTSEETGDGSTTTLILTQTIIQEGIRNLSAGVNPILLKKYLLKASSVVKKELMHMALPITKQDELAFIASISCKDRQFGEMIANVINNIGPEGVVNVTESNLLETTVTISEGMQFNRKLVSPNMKKDDEQEIFLKNPFILVTDYEISKIEALVPILEDIINLDHPRPLLIIAEKLEGEALATLIMNRKQGVIDAVAILPPAFGEGRRDTMEDIAILTGGTFIEKAMGYTLKNTPLDLLGSAESVKISENQTIITGGAGDKSIIHTRISNLRLLAQKSDYNFKTDRYRERLARFVGGIAQIEVGGDTEVEMKEQKFRIETGVRAVKSAITEGVLPGGGTALVKISGILEEQAKTLEAEEKLAFSILSKALKEPLCCIADNAGYSKHTIVETVSSADNSIGFNALTGEYTDMYAAGILDPVKVIRCAVENAISAASTLLTTAAAVFPDSENKKGN